MAYGAILGQTLSSGEKVCRFVIGTSTAGWTTNDCDYLCDGTEDDVEIKNAISALPSTGGKIVILDGTYNITNTINIFKNNVTLSGSGKNSTILKRMWNIGYSTLINIDNNYSGCCIKNLQIDGNKENYSTLFTGIELSTGDTITECLFNNISSNGIRIFKNCIVSKCIFNKNGNGIVCSGKNYDNNIITDNLFVNNGSGMNIDIYNSVVSNNICNNNSSEGIQISGDNNTIIGNTCNNNDKGIFIDKGNNNTIAGNTCNNNDTGIYLFFLSSNNTIIGNTCIRGTGQPSDYSSSQHTIQIYSGENNLITGNVIMGKNYTDNGSNNTWANNKYN